MPFELAVEGAIALAKAKQQVTIGV
jgi:hypothetical protein